MKPLSNSALRGLAASILLAAGSAWLVGARATASSPRHNPEAAAQQQPCADRAARMQRVQALALDARKLRAFIRRHRNTTRDSLIAGRSLHAGAPVKGAAMIAALHRTPQGEALLQEAKDILYALLFGDAATNTRFRRVQRELLTLTVPRAKASPLRFMQAATELSGAGTWQDPEGVSGDERADNVIVEVEYGEVREEWIGDGIVTALRLINNLEVNEQLLYARMIDVEQTTLVR
ncbi:MAG: hypothetical protein R2729_19045 [Bryobacteraceae bacterium]